MPAMNTEPTTTTCHLDGHRSEFLSDEAIRKLEAEPPLCLGENDSRFAVAAILAAPSPQRPSPPEPTSTEGTVYKFPGAKASQPKRRAKIVAIRGAAGH